MASKFDLFAGNKPAAHVGRNGFDGSASRVFTMRPAICRPVFYQHTVPDSSYRINANDIVRASALQTAAFLRGKHELDFYFVPYSQLLTNANDIILQRGDNNHPGLNLPTGFPVLNLQFIIQWASLPYVYMRLARYFMNANISTWQQSMDEKFWPVFSGSSQLTQANLGWLTKQMFYVPSDQNIYSSDNVFVGADCLNLIATLGYGDYYQSFKMICDNAFNAAQGTDDVCAVTFALWVSLIENLDSAAYDPQYQNFDSAARSVNLIPLMAYQKIWKEMYRDTVNDDNSLYDYSCIMDIQISQNTSSLYYLCQHNIDNLSPLLTWLCPRRRMYKRDLATGLYQSTQYGDAAFTIDTTTGTIYSDIIPYDNPNVNDSEYSAYAMKFAFALQQYKEMLLRAGSRTKDVLKAEFGVHSRYVEDHLPHYIGSFSGSLDLNKVAATAETGEYSVGDLAGNVFSALQGNTLEFTCNDYGIVIGIMSFVTDPLHNAFGVDAMNIKSDTFDFYHPAFANMGLAPVSSERFSLLSHGSGNNVIPDPFVLGYAARDIEYKQNLDLVFDNFVSSPLMPHQVEQELNQFTSNNFVFADGSNSNYVSVKNLNQTLSMVKDRVYLLPNCMDSIFKSLDDGDVDSHHFDVCLQISMSEVLPMPVSGMM